MVKYISNINKTTHETHHITMTLHEMTLSVTMTLLKMILSVTSGSHLMIILRPLILFIWHSTHTLFLNTSWPLILFIWHSIHTFFLTMYNLVKRGLITMIIWLDGLFFSYFQKQEEFEVYLIAKLKRLWMWRKSIGLSIFNSFS